MGHRSQVNFPAIYGEFAPPSGRLFSPPAILRGIPPGAIHGSEGLAVRRFFPTSLDLFSPPAFPPPIFPRHRRGAPFWRSSIPALNAGTGAFSRSAATGRYIRNATGLWLRDTCPDGCQQGCGPCTLCGGINAVQVTFAGIDAETISINWDTSQWGNWNMLGPAMQGLSPTNVFGSYGLGNINSSFVLPFCYGDGSSCHFAGCFNVMWVSFTEPSGAILDGPYPPGITSAQGMGYEARTLVVTCDISATQTTVSAYLTSGGFSGCEAYGALSVWGGAGLAEGQGYGTIYQPSSCVQAFQFFQGSTNSSFCQQSSSSSSPSVTFDSQLTLAKSPLYNCCQGPLGLSPSGFFPSDSCDNPIVLPSYGTFNAGGSCVVIYYGLGYASVCTYYYFILSPPQLGWAGTATVVPYDLSSSSSSSSSSPAPPEVCVPEYTFPPCAFGSSSSSSSRFCINYNCVAVPCLIVDLSDIVSRAPPCNILTIYNTGSCNYSGSCSFTTEDGNSHTVSATVTGGSDSPFVLTIQIDGTTVWVGCLFGSLPGASTSVGAGQYTLTGPPGATFPATINVGGCQACATCANFDNYPPMMGAIPLSDTYEVTFTMTCLGTQTVTVTNSSSDPSQWIGTVVVSGVTGTVTLQLANATDSADPCQFNVSVSLSPSGPSECYGEVTSYGTPTAGGCPDPTEYSYADNQYDNSAIELYLSNVSVAA